MADESQRRSATLRELLRRHERVIVLQTIRANGGSRRIAARVLGVSYPTLMRRIASLGITREEAPLPTVRNNIDTRLQRA